MRSILILLKKDITLDKANMWIVILVSIGLPIYISYILKDMGLSMGGDFLALLLNSFYCIFLAFSKLGMIEHKYKGTAYLTLTPITRKQIVLSKYVLSVFLFLVSIAGCGVANLFMAVTAPLTYGSIIIAWAINALVFGIYIPLEFKVGYENVKYYLMAIVLASPFLMGFLGKHTGFGFFQTFAQTGNSLLPFILIMSLAIYVLSYGISVRIFSRKDL